MTSLLVVRCFGSMSVKLSQCTSQSCVDCDGHAADRPEHAVLKSTGVPEPLRSVDDIHGCTGNQQMDCTEEAEITHEHIRKQRKSHGRFDGAGDIHPESRRLKPSGLKKCYRSGPGELYVRVREEERAGRESDQSHTPTTIDILPNPRPELCST